MYAMFDCVQKPSLHYAVNLVQEAKFLKTLSYIFNLNSDLIPANLETILSYIESKRGLNMTP